MHVINLSLYIYTYSYGSNGTDPLNTIIDDISCSDDNFLTLQQCNIDATISSTCNNSNDAFVVCCK